MVATIETPHYCFSVIFHHPQVLAINPVSDHVTVYPDFRNLRNTFFRLPTHTPPKQAFNLRMVAYERCQRRKPHPKLLSCYAFYCSILLKDRAESYFSGFSTVNQVEGLVSGGLRLESVLILLTKKNTYLGRLDEPLILWTHQ